MNAISAALIFSAGVALQGCTTEERLVISRIDPNSSRQTVERTLGAPVEIAETNLGLSAVYTHLKIRPSAYIPDNYFARCPEKRAETSCSALTILYDEKDRILSVFKGNQTETLLDVAKGSAEAHTKLISNERTGKFLPQHCNPPLEEAMTLDAESQLQRITDCSRMGSLVVWRWRCLAAHQGNHVAQNHVGHYFRVGTTTVQPNFVQAHKWYSLAAGNGNERAAELRHSLSQQMTPDQTAEAERLVTNWRPNPNECEFESP